MLKGQLSRVPWLGNTWIPFTFQPALRALQWPLKHSQSLQLAIHTQLGHHCIQYGSWTLSAFYQPAACEACGRLVLRLCCIFCVSIFVCLHLSLAQ